MKTRLGKLCKRKHDHENTGKSLRRSDNGDCIECARLRDQKRVISPEEYEYRRMRSKEHHHKHRKSINAKRSKEYYENENLRLAQKERSKRHYKNNRSRYIDKAAE